MRFIACAAVVAAASHLPSVGQAALPSGARLSVEVQAGNWGDADVGDIESVLRSVVAVLAPDFPGRAVDRVVVAPSAAGPRVLGRKGGDGAHHVLLNVRDRRWDQFAYQFAHELCHIYSNYDQRPIGARAASREHQWFEETVCEAVSLLALKRLAASWRTAPPRQGWDHYAPAFSEYAARLLSAEHRRGPAHESLPGLYARHQRALAANPYARERTEQLAASLLALFERSSEGLAAIGYLNLEVPSSASFAAYLAAWYDCCRDEKQRAFVRELMSLFAA